MFIPNVRKVSKDRYWDFTVIYRPTCRLKIRIFEAAPFLSIDLSYISVTEGTVSDMVRQLPPKHGNSELQATPLAIVPLTQILGACLLWRLIKRRLVTKLIPK